MSDNPSKKFKEDIEYRIYRIKHFARKHGWKLINETTGILEFDILHAYGNPKVIMTINYMAFEIETILNHPKRGITKLIRKGEFSMKIMERIFINPRAHMPDRIKGHYIAQ